jgi:hypothetical protein
MRRQPWITVEPPWLATLPAALAILCVLLVLAVEMRRTQR